MIAALLLCGALVGPPAPATHDHRSDDALAGTLLVSSLTLAWDLGTTGIALQNNPSLREGNPFGVNAETRLALKVGGAGIVGYSDYTLRRKGHHGWANVLRWTYVGLQGAAGINNLVKAHQAQTRARTTGGD